MSSPDEAPGLQISNTEEISVKELAKCYWHDRLRSKIVYKNCRKMI